MTDRATLTALYLDEVARRGVRASELLSRMPKSGPMEAKYQQDYLSRPLFIGHAERDQLNEDLQQLRAALVSLPDLLFGGDLAAFARAAGMTDDQATAVLRSRTGQVTQLARADMYPDPSGLHVLEFNMGSGIEGIDNDDMCRSMLRHPVLREFAHAHRLAYVDTMHTQVNLIFQETGLQPGSFPMVAIADWPEHYKRIGTFLRKLARRWRTFGLDAHACHLGERRCRAEPDQDQAMSGGSGRGRGGRLRTDLVRRGGHRDGCGGGIRPRCRGADGGAGRGARP
jgi:hypothetical protein